MTEINKNFEASSKVGKNLANSSANAGKMFTCPKCDHQSDLEKNSKSAKVPKGSGGCIKLWKCPQFSCQHEVCLERETP